jgi:hypothetical protein
MSPGLFFRSIDASILLFIGTDGQCPTNNFQEILMRTLNSVLAAAVVATVAFGASAAYGPSQGTPFDAVAQHKQDEGTPQNLVAEFHRQDEGTPRGLIAALQQDEGTPQNLIG